MGNCAQNPKSTGKAKNGKYAETNLVNKPIPIKYTLNQTQLIYETVLNAYIHKKTIPECGVIYMPRGGRSHISITLLPSELTELNETYISSVIKLLDDYFISIGVNHEIYINPSVDNPNNYKLYCHLART
jgi:hypothetical protein